MEPVVAGDTRSCGCLQLEMRAAVMAEAISHSPLYGVWTAMKSRCYNPNSRSFRNYGARGITVCERWKASFENFERDMGEPGPGMTLERKDNDGPYDPDNCRWATHPEQCRNHRGNQWVTLPDGRRMILTDYAAEVGIHLGTLWSRMKRYGITAIEAASAPVRGDRRRLFPDIPVSY
jgi:hypothetical protein